MAFVFRSAWRSKLVGSLIVGAALAVPLAVFETAGQAAPTLTIAEAQAQLSALQMQQDQAVEAYNAGQIALTSAQRASVTAQTSVKRQQKKVSAAQTKLATLARAAYMSGGIDPVTGLLSGQGSATVIDKVGNLDQIARVRSSQAVALKAQQTALSALQTTSKQKLALASAEQKKLDAARTHVQQLISAQSAVLNHLQAQARAQLLAQQAAQQAAAAAQARSAHTTAAALVQQAATGDPVDATSGGGAASSSGSGGSAAPVPAASGNLAQTVLAAAYSQMGKPYRYAGSGPSSFDCSGLTMWAFAHAGISLPHSSQAQFNVGTRVSRDQLQPGDLVFFNEGGTIGHVGIYVGGGSMIDANHTGGWVGVRGLYGGFAGGVRL